MSLSDMAIFARDFAITALALLSSERTSSDIGEYASSGSFSPAKAELAGGLVPVALVHEVVGFVNQIVCGYNLKLLFADGVRHGGVHRLDLGLRLSGLGGGSFCDFCGCSL